MVNAIAPFPDLMKRILIVDDHAIFRLGLRTAINSLSTNAEIFEADSLGTAISHLDSTSFDVAIVDINLSDGATGASLIAHIRKMDYLTKIIVISGDDTPETIIRCIEDGAAGYITKGIGDERTLLTAFHCIFSGAVYLPSSVIQEHQNLLSSNDNGGNKKYKLTRRQREVLYYICQGLPNKSIARKMNLSENTVRKTYVSDILAIFEVARRTELIIKISALGLKLTSPST
ncbi:response regulator transcription factor [Ideonella paludis]|uniref:Response regulator transcription factor n=2 Tax=Ideonella paludis TaxID=1233411 RepID=A0ABS5E3A0_9BURK|nr:response regulator transcription factor [Ideonella paludis]